MIIYAHLQSRTGRPVRIILSEAAQYRLCVFLVLRDASSNGKPWDTARILGPLSRVRVSLQVFVQATFVPEDHRTVWALARFFACVQPQVGLEHRVQGK